METFKLGRNAVVECQWKSSRNGFKHVASLFIDGKRVKGSTCTYCNRTWETYPYQSVMSQLIEKSKELLTDREYKRYSKRIEEQNFIK